MTSKGIRTLEVCVSILFLKKDTLLYPVTHLKGIKKVRSEVKLYCYYFSNNVSDDINVTEIFKVNTLDQHRNNDI